ncbi:hypothetical protein BGX26_012641 [Mortierella sp. AD094]|nr:hypothetical protein BGX26_012641 [Mortierella sp. AD094]
MTDNRPPIAITRTRSGQRMWSDPVPRAQRDEFPFVTSDLCHHHHHNDIAPSRTMISASAAPIAAAVYGGEMPLRPLPSTCMAHYRNGSTNCSRYNNNIINSLHDLDLYEDDHHEYDTYAVQPVPRVMRQAPKLLTLDDYNLTSLGYKPVMSRRLPWVSLTGIAITAANVFSGIIPLYGFTVTNGGPAWVTWSYLFIGLMSIIVTLCLAELATAYPTTAGVHHWVYQLGSARRRDSDGLIGILLFDNVDPAFAVNTQDFFDPSHTSHVPPRRAFFMATLQFDTYTRAGPYVDFIRIWTFHEPYSFYCLLNYSGSSSAVYAALSSTLMGSFVFCPQDTIIRMAEESRRPERTMGRLMIGSSVSTLLIGLPLIIVLNYGIVKPIKGLLDDIVPGVRVIMETLGNASGTVFVSLVLVAMFFTGVIRLAAASRTVYSFARDGGLPRSSYWNHLHPSRNTPQRVSWLVTAASMCCIFLFFWGNSVAFQWISSLGCISANVCFVVPLWMRLTHEGSLHFIPGSFTLGRFSRPLHVISIVWLLFLSMFLMLPPIHPVNKNNFNYAPVVMIILAFLFGVSWFKARTDFTGGAKDVSRASHRVPSSTFKDIIPLNPQNPQSRYQSQYHHHEGSQESEPRSMGSSYRKQPSHTTMQKAKTYSTLDKSRNGHGHIFGTNNSPTSRFETLQQQKQQQRRHQVSLTPSRREPVTTNKRQQQQLQLQIDISSSMSPSPNVTTRLGQRAPVSNPTMNSITSIQSHPSSILGIPFSESPEMIPNELVVRNPSPPSPPATAAIANVSKKVEVSTPGSSAESSLLLTRPFGTTANKESRSFKVSSNHSNAAAITATGSYVGKPASKSKTKPLPMSPPVIKIHHLDSGSNSVSSSSTPTDLLTARPLSAIESIFKLGLGLSNKLTGKRATINQETAPSSGEFRRSRQDRAPIPYPSSLADADEFVAHSDYNGYVMMHDLYPFQGGSTLSTQRNVYDKKGGRSTRGPSEYSIEDIVSTMDISSLSSSANHHQGRHLISQFPTLDGYPLLKSPSMVIMGCERNGGNFFESSEGLNLPTMLPLSRTHTIQQSDNEYGASFKLGDSEEGDGEMINRGVTSELDDSYDEAYSHNHSTIPNPKSRLHALTPVSSTPGLFRLPNRDISTAANDIYPTVVPSTSAKNSNGDATARPLPPLRTQPLSSVEGRHDPIERLLLMKQKKNQVQGRNVTHVDPVQQQQQKQQQLQLEQQLQQQLQRTQSVANWVQEQAAIQEKREKFKARVKALKELRKYDPTATLSINSSDSSFSTTTFSDLSENTPSSAASWSLTQSQNQSRSSSVGAGVGVGGSRVWKSDRLRKQNQMSSANNGKLQSLKEGEPLELSRLELVIYADTDDVLSPSIDVESLGAGIEKPSFKA